MDKASRPSSHMYFCTCTNVYIKKEEIPGHLILPHNHKITSFMIASSPKDKYVKSALDQIQNITEIQIQILKSSNNLIQAISKNTEVVLIKLSELMMMYKKLLKYEPEDKSVYKYDIENAFRIKHSLNKEIVNHFEQKVVQKESRLNKIIKKTTRQVSKIINSNLYPFQCMAISSDENLIAVGDDVGIIKIWEVATNSFIYRFVKHKDTVKSIAFGKGNYIMLSGSADSSVRYWDVQSQIQIFKFEGHTNIVYSVLISEDNKFGYSCSNDETIMIWNLLKLSTKTRIDLSYSVFKIGLLKSRNILVAGGFKGNLIFYDLNKKNYQKKLKDDDSTIYCMCISEDEKILIIGKDNGIISIYDIKEYLVVFNSYQFSSAIISIDISPNSKNFASCSITSLVLWDLVNFTVQYSFDYCMEYLRSAIYLKFSENVVILFNQQIYYKSQSSCVAKNKAILLDSIITYNIAISRDFKYIVYCKFEIKLFDVEQMRIISKIENQISNCFAFSSNSDYLIFQSGFGTINICEVPSLKVIKVFNGNQIALRCIAISNDNNTVSYINYCWKLFIISSKDYSTIYQNQDFNVSDIAFSMEDKRFIFLEPPSKIHILNKNFLELRVVEFEQQINYIIRTEDKNIVFVKNTLQKCGILNLKTFEKILDNKSPKEVRNLRTEIIKKKSFFVLKMRKLSCLIKAVNL